MDIWNKYKNGVAHSGKGRHSSIKDPNNVICNRVYTEEELIGNTYMMLDEGIMFSKDIYDRFDGKGATISYTYPLSANEQIAIIPQRYFL